MSDVTPERWLPVVGYEGLYDISDLGRVRSLRHRWGPRPTPRLLKLQAHPSGHLIVHLYREPGKSKTLKVHHLVLAAFIGPCPPGMEGCHNDGNPANNESQNLRWDTRAANIQDAIRHGTHWQIAKTHCGTCGTPYDEENTILRPGGGRDCRACSRLNSRRQGRAKTARLKAVRLATVILCKHCGTQFALTRKDKVFCSRDCKVAAYNAEKRKKDPAAA